MSKISAAMAAALFEQIIGWPYESPGVTDDRGKTLGIDCSGAWARVYRKHGKSIDHGSNSQYRRFCGEKGELNAATPLRLGMAVFKRRAWKDDQRGHRDYGTEPGDLYHVGCVTSVSPLRIVHATPPNAKVDTALGNWAYWGLLKEVDYGMDYGMKGSGQAALYTATVVTQTGPLNLRASAPGGPVLMQIPRGAPVEVVAEAEAEGWLRVRYGGVEGYASAEYLRREPSGGGAGQADAGGGATGVGVFIPCGTAEQARELSELLRGAEIIVD